MLATREHAVENTVVSSLALNVLEFTSYMNAWNLASLFRTISSRPVLRVRCMSTLQIYLPFSCPSPNFIRFLYYVSS